MIYMIIPRCEVLLVGNPRALLMQQCTERSSRAVDARAAQWSQLWDVWEEH